MSESVRERRNKFPNPRFSMTGTRPVWWPDQAQHITYNCGDQLAVTRCPSSPITSPTRVSSKTRVNDKDNR